MKRLGIYIVALCVIVLLTAGYGEAYEAPVSSQVCDVPVMVPFRVWVAPSTASNGTMRSGFYEYVHLQMEQKDGAALQTPGFTPAIMPITPPQGTESIPTM
jgi:hypothetical protein